MIGRILQRLAIPAVEMPSTNGFEVETRRRHQRQHRFDRHHCASPVAERLLRHLLQIRSTVSTRLLPATGAVRHQQAYCTTACIDSSTSSESGDAMKLGFVALLEIPDLADMVGTAVGGLLFPLLVRFRSRSLIR